LHLENCTIFLLSLKPRKIQGKSLNYRIINPSKTYFYCLGNRFTIMKILVIDDDLMMVQALSAVLTHQNYAVETASDGTTGWELIQAYEYDLVLLDLMLPDIDGVNLCRQIRAKGLQMPILLLTGLDSGHDKALGLDAGADDYVVKPFVEEELVARVRALLRRAGSISQPTLQWRGLNLDPSNCEVTYSSKLLNLTPKEYGLLELFLRNSRRVFSCGMILEHLWAYEEMPGEDAVRTHIKGLRQKLKSVGAPIDLIETVYGIGYRLNSNENSHGKASVAGTSAHPIDRVQATEEEEREKEASILMQGVWEECKDSVCEKVEFLTQMAVRLRNKQFDEALKQQAYRKAHALAGSLGIFGYRKVSEIARELEALLLPGKMLNREEEKYFAEQVQALSLEMERSPSGWMSNSFPENRDERSFLLIVDRPSELSEQMAKEAGQWGYRIELASSVFAAQSLIERKLPDIVLLDPCVSEQLEDSVILLADLSKRIPPIPTVLYSSQQCLLEQPEFSHLGGQVCLQKSLPVAQVFEAISSLLEQLARSQSKIVALDDDPAILIALTAALTPWGIKVVTLADPQQILATLTQIEPDLLVLDVEMPSCSGIDLCRQIRNKPEWHDLPILFLTAHTNVELINRVFDAGADDFVSKPIAGPELVTRIIPRLERIRFAKRMLSQSRSSQSKSPVSQTEHPSTLDLMPLHPQPTTIESTAMHQIRQQSAIAQLGVAALKGTNLADLMEESMNRIVQCLNVEYGCILELRQGGAVLLLNCGIGWPSGVVGNTLIPAMHSQALYALQAKEAVVSENALEDSRFELPSFMKTYDVVSSLNVPIYIDEEPYGVLAVNTQHRRTFGPDEIDFLEAIAQIIGGVLKHHRTQASLAQLQAEFELQVALRTDELVDINQRLQSELKQNRNR
jgi:DNA-binding response OmpR family regulator